MNFSVLSEFDYTSITNLLVLNQKLSDFFLPV